MSLGKGGGTGRREEKRAEESEQPPAKGLRWCWDGCGVLLSAGAETLRFIPADKIAEGKRVALPLGISKAFYQECVLSSTENTARLEQMTASINQQRATN